MKACQQENYYYAQCMAYVPEVNPNDKSQICFLLEINPNDLTI